jgi:hypothetical protein
MSDAGVFSDASVFRLLAEEAMHNSSKAVCEDDRRALEDLACTWARAALMSDRVFGSIFISSPPDAVETTSRVRF